MKNIYNRANFIELKTLEYYFNGDKTKAREVYKIRHCLKAEGFELFIKFYLQKLGFKMNRGNGGLRADGGIDLHGESKDQKIYIQCKKYIKNHTYKGKINIGEVRNFFGGVVAEDTTFENALKIFVNTGDYTAYAREFGSINNIEIWDYEDIASICESYNYESFLQELKDKDYKLNTYISYQQSGMIPFLEEELDDNDIYLYLSNIREKLAYQYEDESNIGLIYTNETLKIFAKKRPHNLRSLKQIKNTIKSDFEKYHIDKYGEEIIKGLKMLKAKS